MNYTQVILSSSCNLSMLQEKCIQMTSTTIFGTSQNWAIKHTKRKVMQILQTNRKCVSIYIYVNKLIMIGFFKRFSLIYLQFSLTRYAQIVFVVKNQLHDPRIFIIHSTYPNVKKIRIHRFKLFVLMTFEN